MQVANNMVVMIDYTLTDADGKVIDSSEGKQPLPYLHGAGNIIPGLERELAGKSEGDSLKVVVDPKDGYGVRDERMVQVVPMSAFQGAGQITPGMQFRAQGPQGQMQVVTVTKVEGDNVTVDGNHPLAGVTLNFAVTIKTVRPATPEEIEHGHVHGPGGHHHH